MVNIRLLGLSIAMQQHQLVAQCRVAAHVLEVIRLRHIPPLTQLLTAATLLPAL